MSYHFFTYVTIFSKCAPQLLQRIERRSKIRCTVGVVEEQKENEDKEEDSDEESSNQPVNGNKNEADKESKPEEHTDKKATANGIIEQNNVTADTS